MTNGRGGQPPKIVFTPRKALWASDMDELRAKAEAPDREAANLTIEALQSIDAPKSIYPQALRIMLSYRQQIANLDNATKATPSKNQDGIGRFGNNLMRRSEKMAGQLEQAWGDERLKHLDAMIRSHDLRSHVAAAYEHLTAIAELIASAEGITPPSKAQIRRESGSALKALARKNGLDLMKFVAAFNIHEPNSDEAFDKWYDRLDR